MDFVRSLNDIEPAYIQFQNRTGRDIDVLWINYEGDFSKYVTLKPSQTYNVNTFKTHPWVFVDKLTGVKMMVGSRLIFFPLSNREVLDRLGLSVEQNLRVPVPIRLPLFSLRQLCLQRVLGMLTRYEDVKHLYLPLNLKRDIVRLGEEKTDTLSKYEW